MRLNTKRTAAAGVLAGAIALGGTGIALAGGSPATTGGSEAATSQEQDPSYTGSIAAPPEGADNENGAETADGDAAEAAEDSALQSLATLSPQEATAAALAAVPGTAGAAELGNENGYVVYSVPVTRTDGTTVEVKIDAGDATVLAQETGDGPESGG